MSSLWQRASQELKDAQRLTIIGYSFPEYDKTVIDLFKSNLNDSVHVTVVDKADPTDRSAEVRIKDKYESIFPQLQGRIAVRLDGFEGYVGSEKTLPTKPA